MPDDLNVRSTEIQKDQDRSLMVKISNILNFYQGRLSALQGFGTKQICFINKEYNYWIY